MQAKWQILAALCLLAGTIVVAEINYNLQAAIDASSNFSMDFFQLLSQESNGNLIVSPLSIGIVLSMAAYGAEGETFKRFHEILHLPAEERGTLRGFQRFIDGLKNIRGVDFRMGNKVFVGRNFPMKAAYRELLQTYFRSATQFLTSDGEESVDIINHWARSNTNNRITEFVTLDTLRNLNGLFLANVVYFNGQWAEVFQPVPGFYLTFNVNNGFSKQVPAMKQKAYFNIGELPELDARFITLPYENEEFGMLIIFPNRVDGLRDIERNFRTVNLSAVLRRGTPTFVELRMPKFTINSDIDLYNTLEKIGLGIIFSNRADFSRASEVETKVAKVLQKAFIRVNENGSEAGAVSGLKTVMKIAPPKPKPVTLDRPFFYCVFMKSLESEAEGNNILPLFLGHVRDPVYT